MEGFLYKNNVTNILAKMQGKSKAHLLVQNKDVLYSGHCCASRKMINYINKRKLNGGKFLDGLAMSLHLELSLSWYS